MAKSGEKGSVLPIEGVTDLERVATAAPQESATAAANGEKDALPGTALEAVSTTASERLPFSKARCVALVTTIAAAPFLSVSNNKPPVLQCFVYNTKKKTTLS
jgi:hypothetical protein